VTSISSALTASLAHEPTVALVHAGLEVAVSGELPRNRAHERHDLGARRRSAGVVEQRVKTEEGRDDAVLAAPRREQLPERGEWRRGAEADGTAVARMG